MVVRVANRQRLVGFNLSAVQQFAQGILPECLLYSGSSHRVLPDLPEIEVAIVSDRKMAMVHTRFLGISGSTDVITFQHGEIVVSAETARANARTYHQSIEAEISRYIVHGLLHLNGFTDATAKDSRRMHAAQEKILRQHWHD